LRFSGRTVILVVLTITFIAFGEQRIIKPFNLCHSTIATWPHCSIYAI
jgi:hypothetical protein